MENSPVVPGSPYFIMTYDTAKKLTGITEQTGILAVKNSDGHLDEVLTAVQEIADENGKIEVKVLRSSGIVEAGDSDSYNNKICLRLSA